MMKILSRFAIAMVALAMIGLTGCDKTTTEPTTTIDSKLVAAWYAAADFSGFEASADGTMKPLTIGSQGELMYDTSAINHGMSGKFTKAADGAFVLQITYKEDGRDTIVTYAGLYSFSNGDANLKVITVTANGQSEPDTAYFEKKSIGATVITSGGLTASSTSLSMTVGTSRTTTISGGTTPYSVQSNSNSSVANASISGSTLYVFGLSTGTTLIVVKDNSATPKTVTIIVNVTSSGSSGLMASSTSLSLSVGATKSATISGGTTPYSIKSNSNSNVAMASLSGSTLSVFGLSAGSASIVVKDASSPEKTVTIAVTVTSTSTGLTATPPSLTPQVGASLATTISGGTTPYSIKTAPNSSIATASISGSTLTVFGVAAGSTSVVVGDASSPQKTVTVSINVSSGGTFTTSGSLSFSSNVMNVNISGVLDTTNMTGSGAGGYIWNTSTMGEMYVYAGKYNSPTSIDVVVLMMMDQAAPMSTGTYQTIPVGTTKMFQFMFAPAVNPSDTAAMESVYMLTSGSATISTLSSTAAAGTFSGSGFYLNNGIPVPTQTINVTNGSFNVPLLVGEGGLTVDQRKAIEKIARRMISHK